MNNIEQLKDGQVFLEIIKNFLKLYKKSLYYQFTNIIKDHEIVSEEKRIKLINTIINKFSENDYINKYSFKNMKIVIISY